MPVSSDVSLIEYPGDGAVVEFPTVFKFLSEDDVEVLLREDGTEEWVTQGGGAYSVTGEGEDAGGTVTMVAPPDTGFTLRIQRTVPLTQLLTFTTLGTFTAELLTEALDAQVMMSQQLARAIDEITVLEDVETLQAGVAAIEAAIADLSGTDAAAIDARLDSLETSVAALEGSSAFALDARLDDIETDVANLTGQMSTVQSDVTAITAFFTGADTALDVRVDALEAADVTFDTRADALEAADAAIDTRVDTLEATAVSLDTRVDTLEATDTALDGRLDTLEAGAISLDSRLDTLEADVTGASLQSAIDERNTTVSAITPINSWVAHGGGYGALSSAHNTSTHEVALSGAVKDGSLAGVCGVLAAGQRPSVTMEFAVSTNSGAGTVRISTIGEITPIAGGTTRFCLDGVRFISAP